MVEEKINNTTKIVIGAIIAILAGAGITMIDDAPNALDGWYICDSSLETGQFARLSGTLYTAYPNIDDSKGYSRCINDDGIKGQWHPLLDFAEDGGIQLDDLFEEQKEENNDNIQVPNNTQSGVWGVSHKCKENGCT